MAITWGNEPAGATVLSDWSMLSLAAGWELGGGAQNYTTDATAPSGDSRVLITHHNPSPPGSGDWLIYALSGSPTELYVGMMVKQSNPFVGYSSDYVVGGNNANKTLWMVTNTMFHTCEFYGVGIHSYPVAILLATDGQTDNSHLGGAPYDSIFLFGTGQQWPCGAWHKVEWYMKIGTSRSSRDGIVRWWVDGVQVGSYTNANIPGDYFTQVEWSTTWDGATVNPYQFEYAIDHLRVSLPDGGTTPPLSSGSFTSFTVS